MGVTQCLCKNVDTPGLVARDVDMASMERPWWMNFVQTHKTKINLVLGPKLLAKYSTDYNIPYYIMFKSLIMLS